MYYKSSGNSRKDTVLWYATNACLKRRNSLFCCCKDIITAVINIQYCTACYYSFVSTKISIVYIQDQRPLAASFCLKNFHILQFKVFIKRHELINVIKEIYMYYEK